MVLTSFFQTPDPTVLTRFLEDPLQDPSCALAAGVLVAVPFALWTLASRTKEPINGRRPIRRLTTTLPVIGDTLELIKNADRFHDWIYDLCKKHPNEPVMIRSVGRPDMVIVNWTEAFEDCFKTQFDTFTKGATQREILEGILGDGIFAVDHAKWVHQRKTASNLFTARSIRDSMAMIVRKHTVTLCEIFRKASTTKEPVDLFKLFNRLTIEAFAEIGFGIEMNCLEAKEEHPFQTAFDRAQRELVMRSVRPTQFWKLQRFLGIGSEGELKRNVKVIDDTVLEIIAKSLARRQSGESSTKDDGTKDIVSLFLDNFENSPDSKDKQFDPKYLRDIVVNFLIAGRDTTAQALSWFFLEISRNPHVVTKIRAELWEKLPGLFNGSVSTPSLDQVTQLTYLDAALKETLRLHPSVPFNNKTAENDIVLSNGTFIAKGTTVALPSYTLGRMPHVWGADATEFKPERFIDDAGKIINFPPSKFIAFNAGPRLCLGMNLAMMEMKIVVSSLLSQFDIQVLPELEVTYDFSLTLPVHGELLARVTPIVQ